MTNVELGYTPNVQVDNLNMRNHYWHDSCKRGVWDFSVDNST